jgi:hypothetical protein
MRVVRVLAAACLLVSGCSFLAPHHQSVTLIASDPNAELYADGIPVGTGTATVELARNRSHSVMARVGDRTGVAHIRKTVSPVGILDLLAGTVLLVPFLGIVAPGFWALDEEAVTIMIPAEETAVLERAQPQPSLGTGFAGSMSGYSRSFQNTRPVGPPAGSVASMRAVG